MKRRAVFAGLLVLLTICILCLVAGCAKPRETGGPLSAENDPLGSPGGAPEAVSLLPPEKTAPPEEDVTLSEETQPRPAEDAAPTAPADEIRSAAPSVVTTSPDEVVTPIVPGFSVAGAVDFSAQVRRYTFTLTRRGRLSYAVSVNENPLVVGDWDVGLYRIYYLNGVDGETGEQLLNVLSVNNVDYEASSPNIGLAPGRYELRVTSGAEHSGDVFLLTTDFSPAVDTEIENNDTKTRYTEIWPDAAVTGSASYFGDEKTDVDWFLLRLYEDTAVTLSFTHEQRDLTTVPFVVTLTDEAGAALYVGRSAFTSALTTSGTLGLGAGNYYICVESRAYTALDYTLRIRRAYSGSFEEEPNDAPATATRLAEGVQMRGTLSSRVGADEDFFRLDLPSPGRVILRLENLSPDPESEKDARRLTLLSGNGNAIWADMLAASAETLVSPEIGVGAGAYYLRVDDSGLFAFEGDYLISYTFIPANNWEHECNNRREWAEEVYPGTSLYGTLTDAGTDFDTDWFRFTVVEAGTYSLSLRHSVGEADGVRLSLILNDAGGEFLDALDLPDREGSVALTREFSPGVYFVKLSAGTVRSARVYEFLLKEEASQP